MAKKSKNSRTKWIIGALAFAIIVGLGLWRFVFSIVPVGVAFGEFEATSATTSTITYSIVPITVGPALPGSPVPFDTQGTLHVKLKWMGAGDVYYDAPNHGSSFVASDSVCSIWGTKLPLPMEDTVPTDALCTVGGIPQYSVNILHPNSGGVDQTITISSSQDVRVLSEDITLYCGSWSFPVEIVDWGTNFINLRVDSAESQGLDYNTYQGCTSTNIQGSVTFEIYTPCPSTLTFDSSKYYELNGNILTQVHPDRNDCTYTYDRTASEHTSLLITQSQHDLLWPPEQESSSIGGEEGEISYLWYALGGAVIVGVGAALVFRRQGKKK